VTPPSISCPANVVTNAYGPTRVVQFPAPSAGDNCPGYAVVCHPASGTAFGVGLTTVNCTNTDVGGNQATCNFTVTVNLAPFLQATGQVALERYVGPALYGIGTRDVTFVASNINGTFQTTNLTLTFAAGPDGYGVASYSITNLPIGTVGLSAKTAWNKRVKMEPTFDEGLAVADFTGAKTLRGGDFNGDNTVNSLDLRILVNHWYTYHPAADADGSTGVDSDDLGIVNDNWETTGDPE
jgi:hypothetical protein